MSMIFQAGYMSSDSSIFSFHSIPSFIQNFFSLLFITFSERIAKRNHISESASCTKKKYSFYDLALPRTSPSDVSPVTKSALPCIMVEAHNLQEDIQNENRITCLHQRWTTGRRKRIPFLRQQHFYDLYRSPSEYKALPHRKHENRGRTEVYGGTWSNRLCRSCTLYHKPGFLQA